MRVGKGAGTVLNTTMTLGRRAHHGLRHAYQSRWWARRTRGSPSSRGFAIAFAHPTRLANLVKPAKAGVTAPSFAGRATHSVHSRASGMPS
jgi:hypothetical protein